jgi:serine/threonine-protein kinase RsbT
MSQEITREAEIHVFIQHESDVVIARKRARELALRSALSEAVTEALVTATSEVARNALQHGGGGDVLLQVSEEGGRRAVMVVVRDQGGGISDPDLAMRDGYSTKRGLGLGLSGARRLVDEFQLHSDRGVGTTVILKQWIDGRKGGSR